MAVNTETIDERILKLLKLEDEFEMSYEEYIRSLREALVAARLTKSRFSSEEAEMLLNEFKRVRGKTGRFTVVVKKFTVNRSVPTSSKAVKFLTGKKETRSQLEEFQDKKPNKKTTLFDVVLRISESVNGIYQSLIEQNRLLSGINEGERRRRENLGRSARENNLEKGPNKLIEATKKILEPLKSVWDRIFRFLLFTILGRAFKKFLDWAKDPDNKKRLQILGRLLKDFFPAILGAFFLFATPLGKFVRVITGTIVKLTYKLAKFAIPKLLSFAKSHPLLTIGATAGFATFGASMWAGKESENLIQSESQKTGKAPQQIKTEVESAKRSPFSMFGEGMSNITGYKKGGVFSGLVTNKTGKKVTGYGVDTQYLPMEDGTGGVVVRPGEIVMNTQQQSDMFRDTGRHPLEYVPGPKSGKVQKYASGGVIGNNPNFWSLAAIAAKEAGSLPQGHADVAQSIYNRAKAGFYPGGKSVKGIITAANQYQPTFGNLNAWLNIKDRSTAANAVGKDYIKRLDIASKSLMNSSLQQNASKFVGSRTDFRGESQKSYMEPKKGDITRGSGHNFFGWMTDTAYNKKLTTPASVPSFIPKSVNKSSQSSQKQKPKSKPKSTQKSFMDFFPTSLPFKGGTTEKYEPIDTSNGMSKSTEKYGPVGRDGRIKENSGKNIPGKTDDRQLLNIRVQPGEYLRVFTQNFVDKGGMKIIDYLQAMMDSDSNARKEGVLSNTPMSRYIPPAPSYSNGGIQFITLPPSVKNSGSSGQGKFTKIGEIPTFSAVPQAGVFVRSSNAEIYGIVG
jgi:hypothetical protein